MTALFALIAGLLFGGGLWLSGMTDPANVIAFLDVGGAWRPNLAFTMLGAIVVALPAYAFVKARGGAPGGAVVAPVRRGRVDRALLLGSSLFGVGWGLTGICPGPGLILLGSGVSGASIFVVGLVVGIYAVDSFAPRLKVAAACQ